jgi:hypothetical protein
MNEAAQPNWLTETRRAGLGQRWIDHGRRRRFTASSAVLLSLSWAVVGLLARLCLKWVGLGRTTRWAGDNTPKTWGRRKTRLKTRRRQFSLVGRRLLPPRPPLCLSWRRGRYPDMGWVTGYGHGEAGCLGWPTREMSWEAVAMVRSMGQWPAVPGIGDDFYVSFPVCPFSHCSL